MVAENIGRKLGSDLEEIIDQKSRRGMMGFLRSGMESYKKKGTKISEPALDASEYDLTIIGTPVWAGNMSPPVRAYLSKTKDVLGSVCFFCTCNNSGETTIEDMSELAGVGPIASLIVKGSEIKDDSYEDGIRRFIDKIIL